MLVSSPGKRGERSLQLLAIMTTLLCPGFGGNLKINFGCVGDELTISCESEELKRLVFWKKDGQLLRESDRIRIHGMSVTFKDIKPADQATYKCCFDKKELRVKLIVNEDCKINPVPTSQRRAQSLSTTPLTPSLDERETPPTPSLDKKVHTITYVIFGCLVVGLSFFCVTIMHFQRKCKSVPAQVHHGRKGDFTSTNFV